VPADAADAGPGAGPLVGVLGASTGRRVLAHAIDLLLVAAVALATGLGTGALPGSLSTSLVVSVALAFVVAQLAALSLRGRTVGRLLLQLRTVDDLTALPARPGYLVRQLTQSFRQLRLITADLRGGRDPMLPAFGTSGSGGLTPASQTTALVTPPNGDSVVAADLASGEGRPSVGIVLESGERYQIDRSLVIGRNPVDPLVGADRALLAWPDLSRRLSKTHVLLEWSGNVLWVTDLNSVTGTTLVTAAGDRQRLVAGVRTGAPLGSVIICGGRSVKVVPHG
jgi:hypothetical protein